MRNKNNGIFENNFFSVEILKNTKESEKHSIYSNSVQVIHNGLNQDDNCGSNIIVASN